jgi:prepilin-type N-terminal cleavage/methylation domain-containing protein
VRRRAFTLVELLVVTAIVAVLIGLMLPLVRVVQSRARDAATSMRIEAVLQELSRHGREEGMLSHGLMIAADLPGVKLMTVDDQLRPLPETDGAALAEAGLAADSNTWLGYNSGHHFAFPWGQPTDSDADGDYDDPRLQRSIGDLSPDRSHRLLLAAGMLPEDDPATADNESLAAYRDRRGRDLPWNDAWGSPLVVAYGVYQPDGRDPSRAQVLRALQHYQYNRAVYLVVGSAGPVPTTAGGGDWDTTIAGYWDEIVQACDRDQDGDPLWDESGFDQPPWNGVRVVVDAARRRYLSAPVELK